MIGPAPRTPYARGVIMGRQWDDQVKRKKNDELAEGMLKVISVGLLGTCAACLIADGVGR